MRTSHRFSFAGMVVVLSMVLAACGGAPQTAAPAAESSAGSATTAPAPAEAVVPTAAPEEQPAAAASSSGTIGLDILEQANMAPPAADIDFVKQDLDKVLGTDLKLSTIEAPDDYYTQLNVRLAGSDYPDLFMVDRARLAQYAQQGILLDLTPYFDKLGPTLQFITQDGVKKGQIEGKTYAVAKAPFAPQNTYWVRQDWLDKLGLKAPTTPDELLAVAEAFTTQDPDGNGKNDTYGISGQVTNFAAFAPIFGAYGVGTPGSLYVKDGKLISAYDDAGMKDALTFINKLWATGVVDPDLAANTGSQHRDKAFQGQVGIVYAGWPDMTNKARVEEYKAVNPNAAWSQVAPIKGPGGQNDGVFDIGSTAALWAIPKTLESQPDKLQKIFNLLNYVSEGDGSLLVQFGQKGKHFNLEGNKVVATDLMTKKYSEGGADFTWIYQFTGRAEKQYLYTKFNTQTDYIDFALAQPRIQALNGFVTPPSDYNSADANTYTSQQILAFITGERPLSEYDAFVSDLKSTYGYQTYLDAGQQQLTTLGYVK